MSNFLAPIGTPTQQFFTDQGVILAGGLIYTYLAGTTTPAPTYTTQSGSVANPNPIQLDSAGRPPQEIWLPQGVQYKFFITDANNNPLAVSTFDNLVGIGDTSFSGGGGSNSASEWVNTNLTPTYVSATQFSVPGNQTTTFPQNRRVQATVTAGTIYGTVSSSTFASSSTTVTVVWDAGSLDNGLSLVNVGLLNPTNPSYLSLVNIQAITATGTLTTTNGANKARLRMVGGGGAGGGTPSTGSSAASNAAGGSSGSYLEVFISSGWQSYNGTAMTIGAAGTPVAGGQGGNGGDTIFGSVATAPGGKGAPVSVVINSVSTAFQMCGVTSAYPNVPSTTLPLVIALIGVIGTPGWYLGSTSAVSLPVQSGTGGSNPLGLGGSGLSIGSPGANGNGGSGCGSGGGGAGSFNSGATPYSGGLGAPGIIIIEEYL